MLPEKEPPFGQRHDVQQGKDRHRHHRACRDNAAVSVTRGGPLTVSSGAPETVDV